MKNVLIIGGGFAGLSAAGFLARHTGAVMVTLIDKSAYCNSLPLLPDVIGRDIPAGLLAYPIKKISRRQGFHFLNKEVLALDMVKKEVSTSLGAVSYDYLLIACGSETNFYGNDALKKYACKLDDAVDAKKIRDTLDAGVFDTHIISGGGYTGIEIATNLRRYLDTRSKKGRVIIVERAPSILGPLPEWMKRYVSANLKRMGIEVRTNTVIDKTEEGRVWLSGDERLDNALLIWAAGVKIPAFAQAVTVEKSPQGRLKVDEYLRLGESCFAAGDAAYFSYKSNFLRMGVQFAITQGVCAAANIMNSINGKALVPFRPLDPGYVVPMANNYSCARIFGINMQGRLSIFLHYFMCVYRSFGLENKWGLVRHLMGAREKRRQ
jgi:NADH dehydrogenase